MAAPIIWLELSESSIDTANNTSVVSADLYLQGNGSSWNHQNPQGYITIDGTDTYFNHNFDQSGSRQWLGSASKTVYHNSDGTKAITVSAGFNTGGYYGTLYTSKSFNLTKIARATQPSVTPSTAYPGDAVVINLPRASSNFTHKIWYRMTGQGWQLLTESATTEHRWTIPEVVLDFIPLSSGSAELWVDTYNGASFVGTKKAYVTIKVPDTIVPIIESINISEAVSSVASAFKGYDGYIQGVSRLNIDVHTAAGRGSTISVIQVEVDGVIYNQAKFTSNVLNSSGKLPIKVTLTDSRGRIATKEETITSLEYYGPRIADLRLEQCDLDGTPNSTGTCTKVYIRGSISEVNGMNTKKLVIKHKRISDTSYMSQEVPINWIFAVNPILENTAYDETYEFTAELADNISTVSQSTVSGKVVISRLAGGDGVTFFKEATKPGLWIKNLCCSVSDFFISKWRKRIGKTDVCLEDIIDRLDYEDLDKYFKIVVDEQGWKANRFHAFRQGNSVHINFLVKATSWYYNGKLPVFTSTLPSKYLPDGGKGASINKYSHGVCSMALECNWDLKNQLACSTFLSCLTGNIEIITPSKPYQYIDGDYFVGNITYDIG